MSKKSIAAHNWDENKIIKSPSPDRLGMLLEYMYDHHVLVDFFFRHKVEYIKSTDHPEYPTRVLMRCRDSSIRILSPRTGDIITSLLGDPRVKVIDAAYAIEEGMSIHKLQQFTFIRQFTSL